MNSKALIAQFLHLPAATPQDAEEEKKRRFLHRVSDSWLHTALLVALAALAAVAVYKAFTLTMEIWQLEPVVITGKSTPPGTTPSKP